MASFQSNHLRLLVAAYRCFAVASLMIASSAHAQTVSKAMSGTVGPICNFGGLNSFLLTIDVTANGSNRKAAISLDTFSSPSASAPNPVTASYTFFCNASKTMTVTAPKAVLSANSYVYNFTVNRGATNVATIIAEPGVQTFSTVQTVATAYTLVVSISSPANGIAIGQYLATITIN